MLKRNLFLGRAALTLGGMLAVAGFLGTGLVPCPMARLLHVPCPMCGSTRAARALLALDLPAAFRLNPVAPLFLLLVGALALRGLWLVLSEGTTRDLDSGVGRVLVRGIVGAMLAAVVVWVLRFCGLFGGPCPV